LTVPIATKLDHYAFVLPKLDTATVGKLLCGFNRCIVVGAIKLHRHDKMVIAANDVNQIIGHMRQPVAGSHTDYPFKRIALCPPGSGLKNQKISRAAKLGH
jgi:hypothetical protein